MNKTCRYVRTGEHRSPMAGEFFINPRGMPEQARFDFSAIELPIARLVVIRVFLDGNAFCAVDDESFENIQESPAGFGATEDEAVSEFLRQIQPSSN